MRISFHTSPLFMNDSLPPKMLFDMSVNSGNYMLNQLQLQEHIAKQEVRIAQSGYLPNIALFGKQTLYSHGIKQFTAAYHGGNWLYMESL